MIKSYVRHIFNFVLAVLVGLIFAWALAAFLYGRLTYDINKAEITFKQALTEILK